MTPTTYGRDFAYCLKSHGGVRGFNASLWRFLLRCTLFCHSVATFLTSVSSYEGGCGFEDYLDISNAITAVYLTSYESTECILVEKLVNNTIPVKQVFYTNQSGTCIPLISTLETKEKRAKISKSKNDSYYISIIQQAESLYQQMLSEANGSTSQEK